MGDTTSQVPLSLSLAGNLLGKPLSRVSALPRDGYAGCMDEQPSEEPETIKKPRRRWFQVSLRTFLMLIAIASVGFGWLGYKMMQAREQQQAVEAIRKLGGYVEYNSYFPPSPTWYRRLFGNDHFDTVTMVELNVSDDVTDADLAVLKAFPKLCNLQIGSELVTDEGLGHLRGLTELARLSLSCPQITDVGLAYFEGMKSLDVFQLLRCPQITDAGLVRLEGMKNLRRLGLQCPQITDSGLVHIQRLPKLEFLLLIDTQVTDAGIDHMKEMKPATRVRQMQSKAF